MDNDKDKADTTSDKIAAFFNRQPIVLLVVAAILSLSVSFFTVGLIRVLLGIICVVCSFVILQRAIAKFGKDWWCDSD